MRGKGTQTWLLELMGGGNFCSILKCKVIWSNFRKCCWWIALTVINWQRLWWVRLFPQNWEEGGSLKENKIYLAMSTIPCSQVAIEPLLFKWIPAFCCKRRISFLSRTEYLLFTEWKGISRLMLSSIVKSLNRCPLTACLYTEGTDSLTLVCHCSHQHWVEYDIQGRRPSGVSLVDIDWCHMATIWLRCLGICKHAHQVIRVQ